MKTERDTRTEEKGVGSVGLRQRQKLQHPHHGKVSPWGRQGWVLQMQNAENTERTHGTRSQQPVTAG